MLHRPAPSIRLPADWQSINLQTEMMGCEDSLLAYVQSFWHVLEPLRRPFVRGWHIEAIADHLEAITRGELDRLLINVPPGMMKSLLVNVFWPTWEWGPQNLPSMRSVSASYSNALTIRDNRKARILIQSPRYQAWWGKRVQLSGDQNAKRRFENTASGFMLASSVEGVGTGERGDRFRVDDPHNVKKGESDLVRESTVEWFRSVVPTRLQDPSRSAIMVIMQRVHANDVSGHILTEDLGYEHLMLPMEYEPKRLSYTSVRPSWLDDDAPPVLARYWPRRNVWLSDGEELEGIDREFQHEVDAQAWKKVYAQDRREEEGELLFPARFPEHVVRRDERVLGPYQSAGQLQQSPIPRKGAMFQREWFKIVDAVPEGGSVVRGWDLAGTKDGVGSRTAGVKMKRIKGAVYVLHAHAFRGSPGEVETGIVNLATSDGFGCEVDIPQDPGQAGKGQVLAYVKRLAGYIVRYSPETGDKVIRAQPFSAQCEAGNVKLLRGPWNAEYLDELSLFPKGRFADQVDASSRAYARLVGKPEESDSIGGAYFPE